MSRLQRLRARALSLRGAVALGGAVVMAASVTQVAGTLAAPVAVRTAKMPIASANYYPAPLPSTISCETHYDWGRVNTGAIISWSSAGTGMKYRVVVLRNNDENQVRQDFYTDDTSFRYRASGTNANFSSDRVRIYTVNSASGTTDASRVQSSGFVSHTTWSTSNAYTECSGGPRYDAPNQLWEDSYNWTPGAAPFALQPLGLGGILAEVEIEDPVGEGAPEASLTALEEVVAEPAETPTPSETVASTTSTAESEDAPSVPNSESTSPAESPTSTTESATTRSSTSATTSTVVPSRAPETSTTTRETSTPASTSSPAQTSAPVAAPISPARVTLPGGGEAEIVGDTTLVVSDGTAPVCTAPVRENSTLRVRSGVLELTDAGGTRTVDQETCELT